MTKISTQNSPAPTGNTALHNRLDQLEGPIHKDRPPNEAHKWLTGQQVMDLLSISRRTLQSYRDKGILGFSVIGKKFYYRADEIHQCLQRHYQPPFAG